ncbi:claudin-34-like [Salarias fasciatus]|uniref:claudin-34-like n=1 Tax=Salarias fasciatus TaxID=181472 RepID=UPI0011766812|nr:claudin-34-like [Salarias fasciatus]
MAYLAHTAHAQLAALWAACVGWILISVALGLIQWRVWLLADRDVVSSGVAWVGLWRACFNSHTVVSPGFQAMHCKYIDPTEAFAPPEIVAGQVLMLLSVLVGICGNAGGLYSMRNVYFGVERGSVGFIATGALCLLAAVMSLVPLVWNLTSVVTNQTIQFPPDFKLPPAPAAQYVGCGIGVGMVGAALMVVSGMVFCRYKAPARAKPGTPCSLVPASRPAPTGLFTVLKGKDNPVFELHEHL